jgi:hypothetical protein
MSPDKRPRGRSSRGRSQRTAPAEARTRPGRDDAYEVVYYKRHKDDDPAERVPGREFLARCPTKVRATMAAVAAAVAAAPPRRFSGGGYWEAMHGEMTGYYEIRVDGPRRTHYRLFCRLDTEAVGRGPLLVILCGDSKGLLTTFSESVYRLVRATGSEYLARNPRSIR